MKTRAFLALVSAAWVLSCGADRTSEDVQSTSLEMSQTCGESVADATFERGFDYRSPRNYGQLPTCYKGAVVDVSGYMSGGGSGGPPSGLGGSPGSGATGPSDPSLPSGRGVTRIAWADEIPTTQAACESLWVGAYLFEGQSNPGEWTTQNVKSSTGVWTSPLCTPPFVDYQPAPDGAYRIAASARTRPTSAAPTRKLSVATRR